MMPAIKKAFNLLADDIVEFSTKNESLKNKIGSYDEKWLKEFKAKLAVKTSRWREKSKYMSRMKKQMEKNIE